MNQEIISKLEKIKKYYHLTKDVWRERAYGKAIYFLSQYPNISSPSELRGVKIKGVGDKIMKKIIEYLETGRMEKEEKIEKSLQEEEKKNECVETFKKIYGVGEKKAKTLCESGIKTIAQLRKEVRKNKKLLNNVQKIGLKYYEKLLERLPHSFIRAIDAVIRYYLNQEIEGKYSLKIAGSYRRGTETSGDIDCLISPLNENTTLRSIVKILENNGLLVERLGMKKERYLGIGKCGNTYFHLDIEFIDPSEWGSALLYFTGSSTFNINMRSLAKKMGYTLNQRGLYDEEGNKVCESNTEECIFEKLNMDYVKPKNR